VRAAMELAWPATPPDVCAVMLFSTCSPPCFPQLSFVQVRQHL
jgi:hypothetical protein